LALRPHYASITWCLRTEIETMKKTARNGEEKEENKERREEKRNKEK
jgi:hypothetical protein